jgi:peptidoglycan-N-acetylglucosamine deacetylase
MKILTFDIEEWFHLLDNASTKTEADWAQYESRIDANMDRIFKLLADNNQKATFFCIGWVARKYPHIIKKIADLGFEIATHSDLHQLAYEQDYKTFKADLLTSIHALEAITGKKVRAYRAPGFSIKHDNKWVFETLIECGIEVDCSVFPAKRAHGGFEEFGHAQPCWIETNGLKIKEFPINLYDKFGMKTIFSGGGYFRLLPYFGLDYLTKNVDYMMTYFHPRDFDAGQPKIKELSFLRTFKSYYGLKNCLPKLETLIQNHNFIDLHAAENQIDWLKAKVVKL